MAILTGFLQANFCWIDSRSSNWWWGKESVWEPQIYSTAAAAAVAAVEMLLHKMLFLLLFLHISVYFFVWMLVFVRPSVFVVSLGEYLKWYLCIHFYSCIQPIFIPKSYNEVRLIICIHKSNNEYYLPI